MKTRDKLLAAFAGKILAKRMSMGLTQEQFANTVGLERTQLANIETGRSWISIEACFAIVSKTGLRIDRRTFEGK